MVKQKIRLEKCTYELVAIMDSDDICTKDRFELILNIQKQVFLRYNK